MRCEEQYDQIRRKGPKILFQDCKAPCQPQLMRLIRAGRALTPEDGVQRCSVAFVILLTTSHDSPEKHGAATQRLDPKVVWPTEVAAQKARSSDRSVGRN